MAPGVDVKPGQFVCFKSLLGNTLCGRPMCISRRAGSLLWFSAHEGDAEEFRSIKSAVFVCDTADEGAALLALSRAHREGYEAAVEALTKQFDQDTRAKLAILMQV